ncbi:MAG: 1-acyl-sn-glycerol-3-phosphate acyltransferase [Clostridiales Family XIII bacterium]|jgi:1-acyl-sn-glycerol-3-phosphate acyltransferase|nr:1-acyl-sn-glycerol-3-phosphate acyltransferase [Clostridiales Family XIII bacterium]
MRILKNISFVFWMILSLLSIRKYGKMIELHRREGDREKERAAIIEVAGYWTPKVLNRYRISVRAEGLEHVPKGPALFVSNHQGYGDIFLFLSVIAGKQLGFVAKDSLRRIPLFGKWVARVRSVFLSRRDARSALAVFKREEEWLREGFSFVVFPEGTRSRGETPGSFKKGSLRPAIKVGVPVVPVSISGTWRLFEEKGFVRPGEAKFCVHPAIETKGLSRTESAELSDRVESIIKTKLSEWNAQVYSNNG